MGLVDILQQYTNATGSQPDLTHQHFDEVRAPHRPRL